MAQFIESKLLSSVEKIGRASTLLTRLLSVVALSFAFTSLPMILEGTATPKLKVIFKPHFEQPTFVIHEHSKMVSLSGVIVGARGEAISNVQVTFQHACFDRDRMISSVSGFDGLVKVQIPFNLESMTCSEQWNELTQSQKELQVHFEQKDEKLQYDDSSSILATSTWARMPKREKLISHHLKVNVDMGESDISSARSEELMFEQRRPILLLSLHKARVLVRNEKLQLGVKLSAQILHPLRNAKISGLDRRMIHAHLSLYSLEKNLDQQLDLESRVQVYSQSARSTELDQDEWSFDDLIKIDYLRSYLLEVKINVLESKEMSSVVMSSESNERSALSEEIFVYPRLSLSDLIVDQELISQRLYAQAMLTSEAFSTDDQEIEAYLKNLIQEKRVKLSVAWRTRLVSKDQSVVKSSAWTMDDQYFSSDRIWQRPIITPRAREAQLKIELLSKKEGQGWELIGQPYFSDWIPPSTWFQTWPLVMLILLIVLALCLFTVSRARYKRISRMMNRPVLDRSHAREVCRLTSESLRLLHVNESSNVMIIDALSEKLLTGSVTSLSLKMFGAPDRWDRDFVNLLDMSTHSIVTPEGGILPLESFSLMWVESDGYEPLLTRVLEGKGCLLLPLWPAREALGRTWSESLAAIYPKQSHYGRGDLRSLYRSLSDQGDRELLLLLKEIESSLFKTHTISAQELLSHLKALSLVLDRRGLKAQRLLLFPPSDLLRDRGQWSGLGGDTVGDNV